MSIYLRKYVKIHVVALTCILYNVKSWVEIDCKYAMLIGQNVVVIMSSVDYHGKAKEQVEATRLLKLFR